MNKYHSFLTNLWVTIFTINMISLAFNSNLDNYPFMKAASLFFVIIAPSIWYYNFSKIKD